MRKIFSVIYIVSIVCLASIFAEAQDSGHKQNAERTSETAPKIAAQTQTQKVDVPVKILPKPRALATDQDSKNLSVQGKATLKIEFLDSGEIGRILTVNGSSQEAIEKAITIARRINFEPARKDGKPVTVFKQIQYSFILY